MKSDLPSQEFAQWLGATHPQVYEALFAHAVSNGAARSTLGDYDFTSFSTPELQDIQIDTGALHDIESSSWSTVTSAISDALTSWPVESSRQSAPAPSSGGGGFITGITSAIGSVGKWATSSQGLNSLTQLGTAVLGAVTTANVAKAQVAVIQAQAARAQAGLSPAPISYDSYGNPVYNTGMSNQQMPAALEAAIRNGTAHQVVLPDGSIGYTMDNNTLSNVLGTGLPWYVLVGIAAVVLFALTSNR